MSTRAEHYNEYYLNRRPASFADRLITFWHSRMFNIANAAIPDFTKKTLLEVGVGFGYFANVCRDNDMDYIGVDMNQNLVNELSRQGLDVICSAIPPFPQTVDKVDVIWMSHILEHARDYLHAREMLQAAYDKLDTGGHIVVIVPDYISYGKYFYDIDWSHGFPVTRRRLNQIISDVGFEVILSKHHVSGVTNGAVTTLLGLLFKLMPVRLCDWISFKLFKKTFCSSFMSVFGWRQIIVIAKKQ